MMIIYVKLFINPTIHDRVMGRARTDLTKAYAPSLSADCDHDL